VTRPIAVLRPEPGNRVTAIAVEAAGHRAIRLPLFEARPLPWEVPEADDYDALIVTSANAMRHGGPGLVRLLALPVHAVGEATAAAARRMGIDVVQTGTAGSAELLDVAEAAGVRRALHLAGRERLVDPGGIVADVRIVYASEALPVFAGAASQLEGAVALLHSARAARRLAEIADMHALDRSRIALVAISPRAAEAAGSGWECVVTPEGAGGEGLVEAAIALAD
jgi:uroporphyrinogen-III synthase